MELIAKIRKAAAAVFYHDAAYGEALMSPDDPLKEGDPLKLDHKGLYDTGEDLRAVADELEKLLDTDWQIKDIACLPAYRIIRLPSIAAEAEFDKLLEEFKARHMTTHIEGADIWNVKQ